MTRLSGSVRVNQFKWIKMTCPNVTTRDNLCSKTSDSTCILIELTVNDAPITSRYFSDAVFYSVNVNFMKITNACG